MCRKYVYIDDLQVFPLPSPPLFFYFSFFIFVLHDVIIVIYKVTSTTNELAQVCSLMFLPTTLTLYMKTMTSTLYLKLMYLFFLMYICVCKVVVSHEINYLYLYLYLSAMNKCHFTLFLWSILLPNPNNE